MGNEEGEGGRAREKERMRGSKQEPGTEAKTGSRKPEMSQGTDRSKDS